MTPSRHLTLSARTLAELNDYLKKTYSGLGEDEEEEEREGGFVECHLCMSFVSEVSLVSALAQLTLQREEKGLDR